MLTFETFSFCFSENEFSMTPEIEKIQKSKVKCFALKVGSKVYNY